MWYAGSKTAATSPLYFFYFPFKGSLQQLPLAFVTTKRTQIGYAALGQSENASGNSFSRLISMISDLEI